MSINLNPLRRSRTSAVTYLAAACLVGAFAATSGCGADDNDAEDTAGVDTAPSPTAASISPTEEQSAPDEEMLRSFSDSFDDDHNGWGLPPSEQGRIEVTGGDFVWESRLPQLRPHVLAATVGEAFDRGELDMTDVTVTATVTPQRGAAAMGVFCREVPDTDSDFQWYEFVVRDEYAAIRLADLNGDLDVLAEGDDADVPLGEPATIRATCVDGSDGTAQLTLELNGEVLLEVDVPEPLGNGVPGLQAYDAAEEESADRFLIAWHDFTVEPAEN